MNRSDHWQNLAWLGELLLAPGSALTLATVYHYCEKTVHEFLFTVPLCDFQFRNRLPHNHLTNMNLAYLSSV